jgi:hypothetical protein
VGARRDALGDHLTAEEALAWHAAMTRLATGQAVVDRFDPYGGLQGF